MVNVLDKRICEELNCTKRPMFNIKTEKKGRFCDTHKKKDMVNVISPRCTFKDGDIGCECIPIFNFKGCKTALFCLSHKKNDMIDIRHKRCETVLCLTRANPKFNDYCFYCFVNLFPNDERVRNYKNKEKTVADFVKQEFLSYNWIEDKKIQGGCSKRRPDLLLDVAFDSRSCSRSCPADAEKKAEEKVEINAEEKTEEKAEEKTEEINNQVIIIEIDENQHEHYDCSCENKRLMEISRDLNHRPIVIIKFNPDGYKKGDKKIPSCWEIDKQNGFCRIKKSKKTEWQERLNLLKETIDYWICNKTNKILEIIELNYDKAF
jgi:hypothetical protein